MAVYSGPEIANDGLALHLDAANPKSLSMDVEYLVVGGGGAGGGGVRYAGGGGGGGGGSVLAGKMPISTLMSFSVIVGSGGTATGNQSGTNGESSSFNGVVALGGGGGGKAGNNTSGLSGGSGGGGGGTTPGFTSVGGTGTSGQGFDGGAGSVAGNYNGAGGGGAGAVGSAGSSNSAGGSGIASTISGVEVYYGGGGAGGTYTSPATTVGGLGGGGNSGLTNGSNGTPNTGGGGGGSGINSNNVTVYTPGSGGSGVVIIRYLGGQRATGGTVTTSNGYTIHTFTSSGTFVPNAWSDVSKSAKHGALINGVGYSTDNKGAMVFDGTNDYSEIPVTFSLSSATVSIWLKLDSAISWANRFDVWSSNIAASTNGRFLLYMESSTSLAVYAIFPSLAINTFSITNANTLLTNKWKNITLTSSTVSTTTTMTLYIDGEFYKTSSIGEAATATNTSMFFMRNQNGLYPTKGQLSGASIYNRALSAAEVKQNFEATRGRYGI